MPLSEETVGGTNLPSTVTLTSGGIATAVKSDAYSYDTADASLTQHAISVLGNTFYTYSYEYDSKGNITKITRTNAYNSISTIKYTYDAANQLVREDNQIAGYSWTMTYDNAGNMLSRNKYSYTTGTLGTVLSTQTFTYGKNGWGDVLVSINGTAVTSDASGNILSDGTHTYTWTNGRRLATVTKNGTTWTNTYDADGMRTQRSSSSTTYIYTYDGTTLVQMTVGSNVLIFSYGINGQPMSVNYNGTDYYYVTNSQGDVISILNSSGTVVVNYIYDAWGNITSTTGSMSGTLGAQNPLRYRGYVYDQETGLYYLESRYYDPAICRFINADAFASTGQGIIGNNMFAYCGNNPVVRIDSSGEFFFTVLGAVIGAISGAVDSLIMGGTAEDIAKSALAGAVSGAISGAGVDIGVAVTAATGGAGIGAGLAIAGGMGAIGATVGTGISTDWQADPMDYVASALVGGMTNMVSFGLAPINGEIGKGASTIMKGIIEEGFKDLAMNVATGAIIATGTTWIIRVMTK